MSQTSTAAAAKREPDDFDPGAAHDHCTMLRMFQTACESLMETAIPEDDQPKFFYGASILLRKVADDFEKLLEERTDGD